MNENANTERRPNCLTFNHLHTPVFWRILNLLFPTTSPLFAKHRGYTPWRVSKELTPVFGHAYRGPPIPTSSGVASGSTATTSVATYPSESCVDVHRRQLRHRSRSALAIENHVLIQRRPPNLLAIRNYVLYFVQLRIARRFGGRRWMRTWFSGRTGSVAKLRR